MLSLHDSVSVTAWKECVICHVTSPPGAGNPGHAATGGGGEGALDVEEEHIQLQVRDWRVHFASCYS